MSKLKESIETPEETLQKEYQDDEYFEKSENALRKAYALKLYKQMAATYQPPKLKKDWRPKPHDPLQEKWGLMWK